MSSSHPQTTTSVFQALGSYADRMKEQKEQRAAKSHRASSSQSSPLEANMSSSRNIVEDDAEGSWETVRTGRNKSRPERQDERRGSNSRNWRERGGGEDKAEASGKDDAGNAKSSTSKKDSSASAASHSKSRSAADPSPSAAETATPSNGKPAWGAAAPAPAAATNASADISVKSAADAGPSASAEVPTKTVKPAVAEKATESKSEADAEGSWRARPKQVDEAPAAPVAPAPAKAAPPPTVNAWSLRKPAVTPVPIAAPSSSTQAPTASSSAPVSSQPNGEVKSGSKKSKKKVEPPSVSDATLWPDVVQATKADEPKIKQDKKAVEAAAEEAAQGVPVGKKQKWKAIPAAELQEAADKVAETSRRQAKQKQRQAKGETESVDSRSGRGKKQANEGKKAPRMQRSASQGSERRPNAEELRANGQRDAEKGANGEAGANGVPSTQTSQGGHKRNSPSQSESHQQSEHAARNASSTGTLPQHGFNPATNMPRPPRGRDRDGRGGYGGRGRGNYRSASNAAMHRMYGGELSPLGGNANLYPVGYGAGYGGFYPMPAPGYVLAPGFDASQGTYNGVPVFPRGIPPPPMPVTQIVNIDPQRFYVLGQVEYYFSMQNLAMDFFLRQQMDEEGWIDIAMIASFNRIKSLTPEPAIVREVMVLSSLLEVKGDKVRLAGGEAKRWVLPDAKPSGLANLSPKKGSDATEISHGIPGGLGHESGSSALGMEDMGIPTSPVPKFDVENALMKSSGSANVSSTASVLASEEGKTATPATSVTDGKSESEEESKQ